MNVQKWIRSAMAAVLAVTLAVPFTGTAEAAAPPAGWRKLQDALVIGNNYNPKKTGGFEEGYYWGSAKHYWDDTVTNGGYGSLRIESTEAGTWQSAIIIAGKGWNTNDLSQYYANGRLEFDVKGSVGGEQFYVGLEDWIYERPVDGVFKPNQMFKVEVSNYATVSTNWTHVSIPLKDIVPPGSIFSFQDIHKVLIGSDYSPPQKIWINQLKFTSPDDEKEYPPIKVNQVGYLKEAEKYALVTFFEGTRTYAAGTSFTVKKASDNTTAFTGTLTQVIDYDSVISGEKVLKADFTALKPEATTEYYLQVGTEKSPKFKIGNDVFDKLLGDAMHYYYYQRASVELSPTYAGQYAHPNWHPDNYVQLQSTINAAKYRNANSLGYSTGSSTCPAGQEPWRAVDGDLATLYCDNTTGDKWLEVDLGRKMWVNRYILKHAGAGGLSATLNTKSFSLQVYDDHLKAWVDKDVVTNNTANITDRVVTAFEASKLRLNITNAGADATARIYEFEVYQGASSPGSTFGNVPAVFRDVSGGWYDAGDQGKYVSLGSNALLTLLWTYELHTGAFKDNQANIPESGNGVPDILDEIRVELEWMRKMQDTDGGFFSSVMPNNDNMYDGHLETRYIVDVDMNGNSNKQTSTTANAAAVFTHAYMVFKNSDPSYADTLLNAAKSAWNYVENKPTITVRDGVADRAENDWDARLAAASALYRATGEAKYRTFVDNNYQVFEIPAKNQKTFWDQSNMVGYGLKSFGHYIMAANPNPTVINWLKTEYNAQRPKLMALIAEPWRNTIGDNIYWGINSTACLAISNAVEIFDKAFGQYGDDSKKLAQYNLNFILGINPVRKSFVTNVGDDPIRKIYSNIFNNDGLAGVPTGYMSGGMNRYDGKFNSKFPGKTFSDTNSDWTQGEHGIYWNAALIYAIAQLKNDSGTTTTPAPTLTDVAVNGIAFDGGAANPSGEDESKAFDKSTSSKWLVSSTSGAIGYDFNGTDAKTVKKYALVSANDSSGRDPKNWMLQGSNDGSTWTTLDTQTGILFASRFEKKEFTIANTTAYQMYRLNITANNGDSLTQLAELELYGEAGAPVDRATGGTVSASGENPPYETKEKAFDDALDSKWLILSPTGWIQYRFGGGSKYAIARYTVASGNDSQGRDPKSWILRGSNNGTTWVTLDTRTGEQFASRKLVKSYTFSNTTPYEFYRLEITQNNGDSLLQVGEIELFES